MFLDHFETRTHELRERERIHSVHEGFGRVRVTNGVRHDSFEPELSPELPEPKADRVTRPWLFESVSKKRPRRILNHQLATERDHHVGQVHGPRCARLVPGLVL